MASGHRHREGDSDGNDATAGDPTWDSHQNTPPVSDYPSTQSTFPLFILLAVLHWWHNGIRSLIAIGPIPLDHEH